MNERIRELALEVFSFKYKTEPNELDPGHHMDHLYKFAELIVRECARIARNTDLEDVEGGDSAVLRAAGEQIQKHFGVEE